MLLEGLQLGRYRLRNGTKLAFLVTPFCPEGSLTTWLQHYNNTTQLPVSTVVSLIQQAASALTYAHERKIIHRDVKPSNFLVWSRNDSAGLFDILLADFGVARLANATVHASKTIRGTPIYMAPEQWSGEAVPASDQYALAVMAYELLTRKLPFMRNAIRYISINKYTFPSSLPIHKSNASLTRTDTVTASIGLSPNSKRHRGTLFF